MTQAPGRPAGSSLCLDYFSGIPSADDLFQIKCVDVGGLFLACLPVLPV